MKNEIQSYKPIDIRVICEINSLNSLGMYSYTDNIYNSMLKKYSKCIKVLGITFFMSNDFEYKSVGIERYRHTGLERILNLNGIDINDFIVTHEFPALGFVYIFYKKR